MTSPIRKGGLIAAMLASFVLAGCSSDSDTSLSNLVDTSKSLFTTATGSSRPSITLEQAAAVPYATIGIRAGDGPEHLLVMATSQGGDIFWADRGGFAVLTREGRIVQASGFGGDLTKLIRDPASRRLPISPAEGPTVSHWDADFEDLKFYSVRIDCTARATQAEAIAVLGTAIPTQRVEEACESKTLRWRFDNTYWINPVNGFVWRSVQHLHPGAAPVTAEILRPPG